MATSPIVHLIVLSLPFVLGAALSRGLQHPFYVYQSYDELPHWEAVGMAAAEWPRLVLTGYHTWSGPLLYWLLAGLSLPLGSSLVVLRGLVLVFSWATCAVAYVLFRYRLSAPPPLALAFAAMLALSPFFYGESLYVLSDNPTWLFVVLALERLCAWIQIPRLGRFIAAAASIVVATLMRQVAVWVFLPALVALGSVTCSRRVRAIGGVCLLLGCIPVISLLIIWGGLLPSGGAQDDPVLSRVRSGILSLAVVGLWSLLLVPSAEVRSLPGRLGRRGGVLVGLAAATGLLVLAAGVMGELAGSDPYGIGFFGSVVASWPALRGVSLAWWAFVPLGVATLVTLVLTRMRVPHDRVLVTALLAVVLSAVANPTWYQRYVDFIVLLILFALVASARAPVRSLDVVRWAVVVCLSVAWTVTVALA